jgi:hypothetical protein
MSSILIFMSGAIGGAITWGGIQATGSMWSLLFTVPLTVCVSITIGYIASKLG